MRYLILLLTLLVQVTFAASPAYKSSHPWFTGPLLTPSARVTKVGHFLVEPYVFLTFMNYRYLNNWSVERVPSTTQIHLLSLVRAGMTEKMNFATMIQGFCTTTQNRTSVVYGDLPIAFEYELFNKDDFFGKIFIQEIFPTGKFQKLEPEKFGTDAGGMGSFQTLIAVAFGKLIHLEDEHYLSLRLFINGGIGTKLDVKGFNAYGGDPETHGRIFRGPTFSVSMGAEYSLTENWALALDFATNFEGHHRFKGETIVKTGFQPKVLFSLAPAIEYNFDEHIGIISGCWFSLAGKNANQFASFATAINIFY